MFEYAIAVVDFHAATGPRRRRGLSETKIELERFTYLVLNNTTPFI